MTPAAGPRQGRHPRSHRLRRPRQRRSRRVRRPRLFPCRLPTLSNPTPPSVSASATPANSHNRNPIRCRVRGQAARRSATTARSSTEAPSSRRRPALSPPLPPRFLRAFLPSLLLASPVAQPSPLWSAAGGQPRAVRARRLRIARRMSCPATEDKKRRLPECASSHGGCGGAFPPPDALSHPAIACLLYAAGEA